MHKIGAGHPDGPLVSGNAELVFKSQGSKRKLIGPPDNSWSIEYEIEVDEHLNASAGVGGGLLEEEEQGERGNGKTHRYDE